MSIRCYRLGFLAMRDKHFVKSHYLYLWETHLAQDVIVAVFCDNKAGISIYGAINKLVVVGVGCNKVEVEEWSDKNRIGTVQYHVYRKDGKIVACLPFKNLFVFFNDFVCDAKTVAAVKN